MDGKMYVVERTEWDEDLDGSHEYWEQRDICCVCPTKDAAMAYCVSNGSGSYTMRWSGKMRYSGRTVTGGTTEEGLVYEIHEVPVFT